jgi:hypothetical protein
MTAIELKQKLAAAQKQREECGSALDMAREFAKAAESRLREMPKGHPSANRLVADCEACWDKVESARQRYRSARNAADSFTQELIEFYA